MSRVRAHRTKIVVALAVLAGVSVVAVANAHLVYVALTSQPDCIQHVKRGTGTAPGAYSAARSSC